MSKNYNRCSEENKETDKYGMTAIKTDSKKTVCPGICHRDRPVHKRLRMCGRWNVCIR